MTARDLLGADNIATAQVSVGAVATLIVAARKSRDGVMITNLGTVDVYIGPDTTVAVGTGTLLTGIKGAALTIPTNAALYGISSGAPQPVSVIEVF